MSRFERDLGGGKTPDPSTLLATSMARMELALEKDSTLLADMIAIANEVRQASEAVWQVDSDTLYESLRLDPAKFSGAMALDLLARWIGALDAWHRFANPKDIDLSEAAIPTAAQDAEARLEREGAFNDQRDPGIGLLIPRVCADAPGAAYTERAPLSALYRSYQERWRHGGGYPNVYDDLPATAVPSGANALLQNCVWLPPSLPCGHPDGTELPFRRVSAGYVPIGDYYKTQPLPLNDDLRITVAPLAETSDCVEIVVTEAGTQYLVAPAFSIDRVKAVILRSFIEDSHILLFPEMTIDSEWLSDLATFIKVTRRTNRMSSLRYILLGTTSRPENGRRGENFVSIIDGGGTIIASPLTTSPARQDKICRWNLNVGDQRRFGFDRRPPGAPPLESVVAESIVEAKTVFVFDILGFGRLVCLICASLDHNQPADWLVQNAQPDWIYAPVMDSSTGLGAAGLSPLAKWTVRRAVRAACLSRSRVIVSNSMALQQLENIENTSLCMPDGSPKVGPSYIPDTKPGIALMIDSRGDDLRHVVMAASIPAHPDDAKPIVVTEQWGLGWAELPTIV
jgi:hypothetical protein